MNTGISGEKIKHNEKKSRLLGGFLILVTVSVAFFTVVAGWGGLFNPARYWYIALTSLGFPILFVLNIFLLLLWMLRGRKIAWIPLAALMITVVKIPAMYQWRGNGGKPDFVEGQSEEIPFMSFNVRLFDLYNWSNNYETRVKMFNRIESVRPKILCIQEFYSSERNDQNNVKHLYGLLNIKAHHVEFPVNLYGTDHWGIATFSAFPIVGKGVLYFDKKTTNICIFTDIKIALDTIRVYNCHLQSVRFGEKDYEFLEKLGNDQDDEPTGEEAAKRTRNILFRLKRAFIKRASQVNLIASHIKESPYPVIVCGDFNDTPSSYTYKTLSEGLSDAFRETGSGFGSTYAGPIPGLRIDYILHSPAIASYQFTIGKEKLSDHFPLSANLVIK